jgi:hypothetical protein
MTAAYAAAAAKQADWAEALASRASGQMDSPEGGLAKTPAASQPASGAARPSSSDIAATDIPTLPEPPKTLSAPQGVIAPPTQPAATQPAGILGRWRQASQGSASDFLPGGYISSVIIFRSDGVLEVHRAFGQNSDVALTWRVGYELDEKELVLSLGTDPIDLCIVNVRVHILSLAA